MICFWLGFTLGVGLVFTGIWYIVPPRRPYGGERWGETIWEADGA